MNLALLGLLLILTATLYIGIATLFDFDASRYLDAIFVGAGMSGCLMLIAGMVLSVPLI